MVKERSTEEATIIKKRKAFMVNHKTCKLSKIPTKRIAHFLKPCLKRNALPPKPPKIQSFSVSSKPDVVFLYRSGPLKLWEAWVKKLEPTHQAAWRKAGIFDAIKASTCRIVKDRDLIYSLVEKWCPETNTFVFPWGEATVTLEDVYVLGGFSPLGAPVPFGTSNYSSFLDKNEKRIQDKLFESFRNLANRRMFQTKWLDHFMGIGNGNGNRFEYAAFLALWLSCHVFVSRNTASVTQSVFAIAARISCGAKLALGPAILASIYRELTLMKRERGSRLRVSSLLHLVQVWAYERFPSLGCVPCMINDGDSRLARWESNAMKIPKGIEFIKTCLDSARETFVWRPYNISIENWLLPKYYVDSGMWVVADSHEKWRLIARCLMAGQLDGLDFVERYNPHRVALQFGFDQDIPESVDGSEASFTLGEVGIMKNAKRLKLYLPSRFQQGDVTYRYFDWWRTMVNVNDEGREGCKRKKTTRKSVEKRAKICGRSNEPEAIDVAEKVGGKPNGSVNQEEGNMILSEMLLETQPSSQVVAEIQNLGNEVGQVKNTTPLIVPEEGSGKCEDSGRKQNKEQNLIEHNVKMDKSLECLEADIPQSKTPTKCNGILIRVACEDEPANALCQGPQPGTNLCSIIPVNGHNPFAALCLNYESRINRLEEIFADKATCSH